MYLLMKEGISCLRALPLPQPEVLGDFLTQEDRLIQAAGRPKLGQNQVM